MIREKLILICANRCCIMKRWFVLLKEVISQNNFSTSGYEAVSTVRNLIGQINLKKWCTSDGNIKKKFIWSIIEMFIWNLFWNCCKHRSSRYQIFFQMDQSIRYIYIFLGVIRSCVQAFSFKIYLCPYLVASVKY